MWLFKSCRELGKKKVIFASRNVIFILYTCINRDESDYSCASIYLKTVCSFVSVRQKYRDMAPLKSI